MLSPGTIEVHPKLAEVLDDSWNPEKITLGVPFSDDTKANHKGLENKNEINLIGEEQGQIEVWRVNSLRDLFRGDTPALEQTGTYPTEYVPFFYQVESNILIACDHYDIPTDDQFMEIFNTMRRRPDGRSHGAIHSLSQKTSRNRSHSSAAIQRLSTLANTRSR